MPRHKASTQPAESSRPFYSTWYPASPLASQFKICLLIKTKHTSQLHTNQFRVQSGPSSFKHFGSQMGSCREQRCTPAPPRRRIISSNCSFLKTISWRYIYPLSDAFLIYADRERGEREGGERKLCNMVPCPHSAVKQACCSSNEWGYHGGKQPLCPPCSLPVGRSIMKPVTTELRPVASMLPKGISSHSRQGFDTTKQRGSDFSAHTHMWRSQHNGLQYLADMTWSRRKREMCESDKWPKGCGEKKKAAKMRNWITPCRHHD